MGAIEGAQPPAQRDDRLLTSPRRHPPPACLPATRLPPCTHNDQLAAGVLSTAVTRGKELAHTVVTWPWQLVLRWVAWWAALVLTTLARLGATPQGFVPQAKVRAGCKQLRMLLAAHEGGTPGRWRR